MPNSSKNQLILSFNSKIKDWNFCLEGHNLNTSYSRLYPTLVFHSQQQEDPSNTKPQTCTKKYHMQLNP